MKIITKKEWEKAPGDYKKVYDGTLYMVYREDGGTCFGPVKILEDNIVDFKKLLKYAKGIGAIYRRPHPLNHLANNQ